MNTVTIVPYNYNKPNQYKYYHLCIMDNNKEIGKQFDLSFNEVKEKIDEIKNKYNYFVKGTIECLDSCINYLNSKNMSNGIVCLDMKKEDIFKANEQLFVDCTEYFKKLQ